MSGRADSTCKFCYRSESTFRCTFRPRLRTFSWTPPRAATQRALNDCGSAAWPRLVTSRWRPSWPLARPWPTNRRGNRPAAAGAP
eukprot:5877208-Alexandrium_andersonii.AAC.1